MIIQDALYAELQHYLENESSKIDDYKHLLPTFFKGNFKRFKKLFAFMDLLKKLCKSEEFLLALSKHLIHEISPDCALNVIHTILEHNAEYKIISDTYVESIDVGKLMNSMEPGTIMAFNGFKNDCPGLDEKSIFGTDLPRAES